MTDPGEPADLADLALLGDLADLAVLDPTGGISTEPDTASRQPTGASRRRSFADWYFRNPRTGEVVLGERPNVLIVLVGAATAARWVLPGRVYDRGSPADLTVAWLGTGLLAWWAADELLRGSSPYRRTIGLLALGHAAYRAPRGRRP